jgi:hypothetical protein
MYQARSTKNQPSTQPSTDFSKDGDALDKYTPYKYDTSNDMKIVKIDKKPDWLHSNLSSKLGFRNDELNETFTSLKAKRNVSDYQNTAMTRPIYSRERIQPDAETGISPGFSVMGLENSGNT